MPLKIRLPSWRRPFLVIALVILGMSIIWYVNQKLANFSMLSHTQPPPEQHVSALIPLSTADSDIIPKVLLQRDGMAAENNVLPLVEIGRINIEKFKFDAYKDEQSPFYQVLFASRQTFQKKAISQSSSCTIMLKMMIERKKALEKLLLENPEKASLYYAELREYQVSILYHAVRLERPLSFGMEKAKKLMSRDVASHEALTEEERAFLAHCQGALEFIQNSDFSGSSLCYNQLAALYKSIYQPDAAPTDRVSLRHIEDLSAIASFQTMKAPSQLELYWLFMNQFERYLKTHFDELKQRSILLREADEFHYYAFTDEDYYWPVLFAAECFAKFWILSPFLHGNRFIGILLCQIALICAGYPPIQFHTDDLSRFHKILTAYFNQQDASLLYTFVLEKLVSSMHMLHEKVTL
jgi:hypothetical protein